MVGVCTELRAKLRDPTVHAHQELRAARRASRALQQLAATSSETAAIPLPLMILDRFVSEDARLVVMRLQSGQ